MLLYEYLFGLAHGMRGVGDARTDAGYGRLTNRFSKQRQKTASYPYDPLDLEANQDEDEDDVDEDEDVYDDSFSTRFRNMTNMGGKFNDKFSYDKDLRDRSSFFSSSSRIDLAEYDPELAVGGSLMIERIFTPSARSSPNAPKYSGTKFGYAAPPLSQSTPDQGCVGADCDDVTRMSLRDFSLDPEALAARKRIIKKRKKHKMLAR